MDLQSRTASAWSRSLEWRPVTSGFDVGRGGGTGTTGAPETVEPVDTATPSLKDVRRPFVCQEKLIWRRKSGLATGSGLNLKTEDWTASCLPQAPSQATWDDEHFWYRISNRRGCETSQNVALSLHSSKKTSESSRDETCAEQCCWNFVWKWSMTNNEPVLWQVSKAQSWFAESCWLTDWSMKIKTIYRHERKKTKQNVFPVHLCHSSPISLICFWKSSLIPSLGYFVLDYPPTPVSMSVLGEGGGCQ